MRPFTIRDTLILVAAVAVGVFGCRYNHAMMTEAEYHRGYLGFDGWEMLAAPGLAAATAGLVLIRLLPPRPSRIDLFRQPGFSAACVALALTGRRFLETMLRDRLIPYDDWWLGMEWERSAQDASLGILVAWSSLILAGSLKAERSWIDRASRAVAAIWVFAGIASSILQIVQTFLWNRLPT
jgi:hypothetical protein